MITQLNTDLSADERAFLISIKEGNPRWELLSLPGIENLPGLQWKLNNVRKMPKEKRTDQLKKLRDRLGI
ncbi:MAG: hypothetical protein A3K03_09870 [Bdellovibrionales bacterium RIFOXYD1_FULL_44_7]|nr:MAG: hypothetical protein A3K03_09870 [Bdellovibrionales bacterium RIFOXYD1_FULL_44_7]